ncbi:hypothetical protein QYF36_018107 [Acer negundo]|nr:hypothetical protein QYF36_018107 [Acer negundo]
MKPAGGPTNTTGSGVVEYNRRKILVKSCWLLHCQFGSRVDNVSTLEALSLHLQFSSGFWLGSLFVFNFEQLFVIQFHQCRLCVCWRNNLFATSFFLLEVVHGAIGIVPSGVLFPLMQWGGRTFVLLMIVRKIDEVQESPSVFICFVAWSLSEVIRYPYYALNCIGNCSSWITLLRYTAFLVLYPIGLVPGEMWLMYGALPYIKVCLYADYFAFLSFSYYNFVTVLLVCYPFLGLNLYLYLLKRSRPSKRREKKQK